MPIRPQHRWLYPIDWPQFSAVIRLEHAGAAASIAPGRTGSWSATRATAAGGTRSAAPGEMDAAGWVRAALASPAAGALTTMVYLATAHLDHDPGDSHPRNLAALCQRCHLAHDRQEHQRRRWITMRMRTALGDLFLGPYSRQA